MKKSEKTCRSGKGSRRTRNDAATTPPTGGTMSPKASRVRQEKIFYLPLLSFLIHYVYRNKTK